MNTEEQIPQTGNRSLDLCRRTVTTESFIAEAKEIYGDCYDYSKVEYKNKDHRVTIICPVHGDFQVYALEHLDGKGCPKCEKSKKFLAKLHEKFGDKFGLEQFVYDSSTTPVTLICPTHGEFSRLPNAILNSPCGCPECGLQPMREAQAANIAKRAQEPFKRGVATQKKMAEFREKFPEMTDDLITSIVSSAYPNIFVDNLEVATEIVRELIRRREEYSSENFMRALIELNNEGLLKGHTIEVQQQNLLFSKTKSLINYIYETAQERTLYLSECKDYKDPQVKAYYDDLCKQRKKPLAKVLYSLLNVEAMYRTTDDAIVQGNYLQFHCYTEPNGDIVFTKNRRTKEDYDEEGNPLYSEEEIVKRNTQPTSNTSGCLGVIVLAIVLSLGFIII